MTVTPSSDILLNSQLPEFIKDNFQTFELFLQSYYEYLNLNVGDVKDSKGTIATTPNAEQIITQLTEYRDIDTTLDLFIDHFRSNVIDVAIKNINNENILTSDFEKLIIKRIKDLYLSKGSPKSYELLFRMLFNDNITTSFPRESIISPSASTYLSTNIIRFDLGNINNEPLSALIKTLNFNNALLTENNSQAAVIDFGFRQIEAIGSARTVLELTINETLENNFNGGAINIVTSENPIANITLTPSRIINGISQLSTISTLAGTDSIYGYRIGDTINFTGSNQSGIVEIGAINSGSVNTATVRSLTDTGTKDYQVGDAFKFNPLDNIGTGGFIVVTEVDSNGKILKLDGQNVSTITNEITAGIKVREIGSGYKQIPDIIYSPFNPDYNRGTTNGDPLGTGLLLALKSEQIGHPTEYLIVDPGLNYGTSGAVEASEPVVVNFYNEVINIEVGSIVEFQIFNGTNYISTGIGGTVSSRSDTHRQLTLQERNGVVTNFDNVNSTRNALTFPSPDNIVVYLAGPNALPNNTFADLEGKSRLVAISEVDGEILETYTPHVADLLASNLAVVTSVVHQTQKKHANEFGLLNTAASSVIRDGYFYQEHSYVVESQTGISTWRDIVKTLVHPAGSQLFSKIFVSTAGGAETFVKVSNVFARQEELLETESSVDLPWPNRIFNTVQETSSQDEINEVQSNAAISNFGHLLADVQNSGDVETRRRLLAGEVPLVQQNLEARTEPNRDGPNPDYNRSSDLYYWYDGYANHSEDIRIGNIHNFNKYGSNGFTDIAISYEQQDNGGIHDTSRESSRFPKGNTPIRVEDASGNPIQELFLPTPTIDTPLTTNNNSTNLANNSVISLTRGVASFDAVNEARFDNDNISDTNGNAFWDYEPRGFIGSNSTQNDAPFVNDVTDIEIEAPILKGDEHNFSPTSTEQLRLTITSAPATSAIQLQNFPLGIFPNDLTTTNISFSTSTAGPVKAGLNVIAANGLSVVNTITQWVDLINGTPGDYPFTASINNNVLVLTNNDGSSFDSSISITSGATILGTLINGPFNTTRTAVDRLTLFTDYNANNLKVRPALTEGYATTNSTESFTKFDDDKKAPFLAIPNVIYSDSIFRTGDIKTLLENDLVNAIAGTLTYSDEDIKWDIGPLAGQVVLFEGLDAFQAKWG